MTGLRVTLRDDVGTASYKVELPPDVTVRRLIPALLNRLNLPMLGPDGEPLEVRLDHDGRRIGEEQTLQQAGVAEGDTISLCAGQIALLGGERIGYARQALAKEIVVLPTSVEIPIAPDDDLQRFANFLGAGPRDASRQVSVILWDLVSVCIRPAALLPKDVQMRELLPALGQVSGAAIQIESADGPFEYELRLKSGRTILGAETLENAGVKHGDTLFFLLGERRDEEKPNPAWTCAECGHWFPETWPYCGACGAANVRFRGFCARCSERLPPDIEILFCPTCGTRLPPSG